MVIVGLYLHFLVLRSIQTLENPKSPPPNQTLLVLGFVFCLRLIIGKNTKNMKIKPKQKNRNN